MFVRRGPDRLQFFSKRDKEFRPSFPSLPFFSTILRGSIQEADCRLERTWARVHVALRLSGRSIHSNDYSVDAAKGLRM